MIPEEDPPKSLYNKEEIEIKLDKIDVLEKQVNLLNNKLETLTRSNKSQHDKIWLRFEEGDNDV